MASLAEKVHAEQQAVTAGTSKACGATHPHDDVETVCARAAHLPDDDVHVGLFGADAGLLQWAEPS